MAPEAMAGAQGPPAVIMIGFKLISERQWTFVVLLRRATEMVMNGLQISNCPFRPMGKAGQLAKINIASKW